MQRILYQIQAYIGRLVLLLTKEFGQIKYLVVKTENLFIIFTFLKNMEMVKITTIFALLCFENASCPENIVPVLARRGAVACIYF